MTSTGHAGFQREIVGCDITQEWAYVPSAIILRYWLTKTSPAILCSKQLLMRIEWRNIIWMESAKIVRFQITLKPSRFFEALIFPATLTTLQQGDATLINSHKLSSKHHSLTVNLSSISTKADQFFSQINYIWHHFSQPIESLVIWLQQTNDFRLRTSFQTFQVQTFLISNDMAGSSSGQSL